MVTYRVCLGRARVRVIAATDRAAILVHSGLVNAERLAEIKLKIVAK